MRKLFSVCLATILSVSLFSPAVFAAEKPKQPEGFYGLEDQINGVHIYDETRMVAYCIGYGVTTALGPNGGVKRIYDKQGDIIDMKQDNSYLTALVPKPLSGELGKKITPVGSMDILLYDDTRYFYGFYENGVTVAKALPGKAAGKEVSYSVDKAAYQTLLKAINERISTSGQTYWLTYMRDSRATKVTVRAAGKTRTLTPKDYAFLNCMATMRRIEVKPDSMHVVKNAKPPKSGTYATIDFDSKVCYTIVPTKDTLTIYVNDRDYALRYDTFFNTVEKLELLVQPNTIYPAPTGKPVIYLYPTQPTDVAVKLGYKGQLATTEPTYAGGWNVTAYPDGRLVNKADGREYPYLFWDGYDDTDWDFSKGFVVAGADSERFLQEKLAYMGLNAIERRDFLEYWLPYLQTNAYNQITFATEQYESLAPLAISPAPDSMLRVFMTYRPLAHPVEIPVQTLKPFVREGFTAVEWGGAHLKQ